MAAGPISVTPGQGLATPSGDEQGGLENEVRKDIELELANAPPEGDEQPAPEPAPPEPAATPEPPAEPQVEPPAPAPEEPAKKP